MGKSVSGLMPFSKRRGPVTSLKVDPGGSRSPAIARLMSGSPASFSSAWYRASTVAVSWLARAFGSNVGFETIARIAPVFGSSAITAPVSPCSGELVPGDLLRGRVDRQFDGGALRCLAGDDLVQLIEELLVADTAELGVHRTLDAGGCAEQGEVSGDRGVDRPARVDALELVLVAARHRLGDGIAVHQDRAPLGGEAGVDGPGVAAVRLEPVGGEDLDRGARGEQRQEHQQHDDADPLQLAVHWPTTKLCAHRGAGCVGLVEHEPGLVAHRIGEAQQESGDDPVRDQG